MKIRGSILLTVIIISISIISCSPKFMKSNESYSAESEKTLISSEELLTSYKKSIESEITAELPSPLEKETEGLRYILEPYFNNGSDMFIGDENKEFLESNLLNIQNPYLPITAENWERVVQIIFSFGESDQQALEMYISEFAKDNEIKRQYAVSSLMKLISLKYRLALGGDTENFQKSEVISDLDDIDDGHEVLIRQAYCLGFTDYSVEKNRNFRPFDSLNSAEAVSMLYRILSNLGFPVSEQDEKPDNEEIPSDDGENLSETAFNAFSIESILLEYNEYKADLENSKKSTAKKRLEMLQSAEKIIGINFDGYHAVDKPLMVDQWAKILNQVFGLESQEIDPYLSCEADGALAYDIAAISIMMSSNKLVGYSPRDANEKEIEAARAAIPQFDTARDISKFAQMFSSGLLEGLYNIPGFTPQRPVSEIEALLLVKRIIENLKIK